MAETVSLLRALLPTFLLASVFLSVVTWLERGTRPNLPAITRIEARPAELPADLGQWHDEEPLAWKPFELPLKVCRIRCTTPYTAWRYRFQYQHGDLADPALYFPFIDANIALYLNGSLIEMKGRVADPPSVYRYDGRLIRLPVELLRQGDNEVAWLLTIERRGTGSVMSFYLGNYAELEAPLRNMSWLTDDLVQGSFWLQLAALLFALVMILRGSRERVLLWFAAVSPFWLTIALWHLVPDWIVSTALRFAALYVSLFGIITFSLLFVVSILESPPRWLTRSAITYFVLGTLLSLGASFWPDLDGYWRIALPHYAVKWSAMLILPYVVFRLYGYLDRQRDSLMAQWTLAAALLPAICGVHDAVRGTLGPMAFALYPISGIGISIAFCLELGRRVLANQARMARYSEELAATVQAREEELAENYAKLKVADREHALALERQRIMQDMHDGVAGQLTALVYLANDANVGRTQIIEAVRAGLVDMRLVLDSLSQQGGDLAVALGAFRGRIEPLLRANGIQLIWGVDRHLDLQGFSPEVMLGVLRILQEALSNAVKHANARCIELHAVRSDDRFVFSVVDNGQGFVPSNGAANHYGVSGMTARAHKLGANLSVESAIGSGTRVQLEIALPPGLA
ncbi:MAG: hypothetical protein IPK97_02195 [Ahniella sp.]|nr:hypothetical protein [Ahniella sp.]